MFKRFFDEIDKFLKLVKFSHTIFALPFALIGFFLAVRFTGNAFSWRLLGLILMAMVFARNSAMGFNRYLDRDIDAKNPRTASREIPAGHLSPRAVKYFVIINILLFLAVAFMINSLCFYLAFPAVAILLLYSYMKRFTSLCHYVLGLALAIAPIGAYLSIAGEFHFAPIILSLIVLLWASGFDIIYSLADEEFDKEQMLHSVPQLYGKKVGLIISAVGHALVIPLLYLFYVVADMGTIYLVGATIFAVLLIYQHLIVSPTNLSRINAAFFTSNGIASVIFAVFTIWDILCHSFICQIF
ncbi:MAG: UbiA-like polyprenyltransferase [Rikenellaceae bacterium]